MKSARNVQLNSSSVIQEQLNKQNNKLYIIITSRLYKIYIVCIKMFIKKNIKQEQKKIKNRKIKSNI